MFKTRVEPTPEPRAAGEWFVFKNGFILISLGSIPTQPRRITQVMNIDDTI